MDTYTMTDRGLQRPNNQDAYANYFHPSFVLLAVCDGMGGHQQGEVASHLAADAIRDYVMAHKERTDYDLLLTDAVQKANLEVFQQTGQDPDQFRMGTTVVACIIQEGEVYIAHVGDSRFYLYRQGQLKQITKDHSLVADMVRRGALSEEDAQNHPDKSALTRALGMDDEVEIDLDYVELEEGDILLLCTDGLTNMVSDPTIAEILSTDRPSKSKCEELIERAKDQGGLDNITATIYQYRSESWKL